MLFLLPNYIHVYAIIMQYWMEDGSIAAGILPTPNTLFTSGGQYILHRGLKKSFFSPKKVSL